MERKTGGAPSPRRGTGLAVVTVAYHSDASLSSLAADLARQSQPPSHWILVDNSPLSAPLAVEGLSRGPLQPVRVEGKEGAGFGEGCNQGFEALRSMGWDSWIWLLNPDSGLPEGREVEQLVDALAAAPATAVVGTAVMDEMGGFEASGGWLGQGLNFRGARLRTSHLEGRSPLRVDWLSGCSLALQPEVHQPPARFDPRFPLYYEDMDLCCRLARQGAPILWLPALAVRHRRGSGSATPSPRRLQLSTLSYLRFLQRHAPRWVMLLRCGRLLLLSLLRLPLQPHRSLAALDAMAVVLRESPQPR